MRSVAPTERGAKGTGCCPRTDGVSGEFRPLPASARVRRAAGQGLADVRATGDANRRTQGEQFRDGSRARVHSWELTTAVDGPGTRLTVFLAGCPLRCLYCHNPDTLQMRRGEAVATEDLIARMLRYRRIFSRSGGGITLSGGEPLMQPAAVARMLGAAKSEGIHTALDTSGNLGQRCSDSMLADLDLCLLDIKAGSEETYRAATGGQLQPTVDFAGRLASAGVEVWARFVLVPGLTDAPSNVERVAQIAASIPTCTRVEVLPFHQMGRDKWAELGLEYRLNDTRPPDAGATEAARLVFRNHDLTTY